MPTLDRLIALQEPQAIENGCNVALETEVRAAIDGYLRDEVLTRLSKLGFTEEASYVQREIILDTADAEMFRNGRKLRIRAEKGEATLTYKGSLLGNAAVSQREEFDVPFNAEHLDSMTSIFLGLGYSIILRIEKKRTMYHSKDVTVTLDDWPIIGWILEVEGPRPHIEAVARQLAPEATFGNYRLKDLIVAAAAKEGASVKSLQEQYERQSGNQIGDLSVILDA